ncbi:Methyltransferase type 12 [Oscillatoria nigro-viridis PCC 7112]|uniref:Methyltransferase type 12 n=1 Tax=Phormidium nigroviride PCC 7112 TaxID=179408 RepID=K9VB49_9CYAN|nr:methyltransferase domain-containing protein [Oscillatoria nigro-viridis]AFZ05328.1 Methyltransferase type 12 [Oscillatoria nigro-viridis PCC 7112]
MDNKESDILDKIRQQFDNSPYPRISLEHSPKNSPEVLYFHNLVTAYYLRNRKLINTEGKLILDAGCGTGYTSLVLALANPGAKIVGIDFSEESVKLAQQRLEYHEFKNAEFHVMKVEDIPKLCLQFDYINADEVLYILPDPLAGMQAMKSVLKPDGIIRTNLHSSLGRTGMFRAQAIFKLLGLLNDNPGKLEIEIVREMMNSLKDESMFKRLTWNSNQPKDEEWILMNYLLLGDKGYTVPEMFAALRTAGLELIQMVAWRRWELTDLFVDPDNLPVFLAASLPETSVEDQLHLFELLHPANRLLDFWCGHPGKAQPFVPVAEWTLADWQAAQVHLHPQLSTPQVREDLINCINDYREFEISSYVSLQAPVPVTLKSIMAACLLPLWDSPQSVQSLAERWLKLRPLHPVSLEPVTEKKAFDEVKDLLKELEALLYVLLKR